MPPLTRDHLCAVLTAQVQAVADDAVPAIARDYPLGSSGAIADLAVAAEEFIGFVLHIAGEPLAGLAECLAICARYFDRVVVVTDEAGALSHVNLAGAAVWSIDAHGGLHEHRNGRLNHVSPAALFDLMSPDQRSALLRPALSVGPYDRATPPVSVEQVRAQVGRHLGAPPRCGAATR